MIGIGISLEDLGIEVGSTYEHPATQENEGFPKEYDFTLDHALLGSWWQVRDALRGPAESAYEDDSRDTPLWFTLFWAEREDGDTEESIEAALTGVAYDEVVHDAFEQHLRDCATYEGEHGVIRQMVAPGMPHQEVISEALATNERTPQDLLEKLVKDTSFNYELLENPSLTVQMVRDVFAMVKSGRGGPGAVARAKAFLPEDVIEALTKTEYPDSYIPGEIARRPDVTEQALFDLIGKCDARSILESPACTDRVRREIVKLSPSGGALTPERRDKAAKALKQVRSAIKSGRTGAIERRRGAELDLLNAVRHNPDINLFDVDRILQDQF